ncbi:hypothetical protein AMECASPLE_031323 [Ameca splendens]|uniref:Uncharacterized protein n=1 Tax=Ameca splendens TaxID=208324 RepID=A0ABV0YHD4_9TELE
MGLGKGKDDYKPAATSEDGNKKHKKEKQKKDMEELKQEVDLVSILSQMGHLCPLSTGSRSSAPLGVAPLSTVPIVFSRTH